MQGAVGRVKYKNCRKFRAVEGRVYRLVSDFVTLTLFRDKSHSKNQEEPEVTVRSGRSLLSTFLAVLFILAGCGGTSSDKGNDSANSIQLPASTDVAKAPTPAPTKESWAAHAVLDVTHPDGYRAALEITVGAEMESNSNPCTGETSDTTLWRSRDVSLSLTSVPVNGFDWPDGDGGGLFTGFIDASEYDGFGVCIPQNEIRFDGILRVNEPVTHTLRAWATRSPRSPNGDWEGWDWNDVSIRISKSHGEGITAESCRSASGTTGFTVKDLNGGVKDEEAVDCILTLS